MFMQSEWQNGRQKDGDEGRDTELKSQAERVRADIFFCNIP